MMILRFNMIGGLLTGLLLAGSAVLSSAAPASTASNGTCKPNTFPSKPRVFILSDISNEPDDQMSLVRLLLYTDQLDLLGLGATTSIWLNDTTDPEAMHTVVSAYGEVVDNLRVHSSDYPSAEYLHSIISSGAAVYGDAALTDTRNNISAAATHLISAADASTDPLWVLCWGGTNTLAQALFHVYDTRNASAADAFLEKLRVYAISDQDNTGIILRQRFPRLFYIVSQHGWNQYRLAAWTGVSGETYYEFDNGGPDSEIVSQAWLREHIQVGPLGAVYPNVSYIMEGDTPSQLFVYQNGLNYPEEPSWGGWGGRYGLVDVSGKNRLYGDISDRVVGKDGQNHTSSQATIWRWREAYQNDFAARIQWTLADSYDAANHAPVAVVNGSCSPAPIVLDTRPGETVLLDASESYDPDGDEVTYTWWQYGTPTMAIATNGEGAPLTIEGAEVASVTMPGADAVCADDLVGCQNLHLILEVRDESLVAYRRVLFRVSNATSVEA